MSNPWQHFVKYSSPYSGEAKNRQAKWLADCLKQNQLSVYGQQYQFTDIAHYDDYAKKVPIVDYQDLLPYIEQMAQGEHHVLFCDATVAFEKTGGSHSGGKLIPYSQKGLDDFRKPLLNWLAHLITAFDIHCGCAYWALSPAMAKPQYTQAGTVIGGGDALYLGEENLYPFAQLSAVPMSVGQINDINEWQITTLYYLICREDLRLISVWSPSFLLQLIDAIETHSQKLFELISNGGCVAGHQLPADQQALQRFNQYQISKNTIELWPQLNVISCWADATSKTQAQQLQHKFTHVVIQPKGLLSTECIVSVPFEKDVSILCCENNFYEFINAQGALLLAHELEVGQQYTLIVTTHSGLYRYNTHDVILCCGFYNQTPLIQFVGRDNLCSDLVGEKLTEPFINHCLSCIVGFAVLCTYQRDSRYYLIIDKQYVTENQSAFFDIETRLYNNPQYAYARQLKQLKPLVIKAIEQPATIYINEQLKKHRRLGDIKLPSLITDDSWLTLFNITPDN